ncbi:MAG: purine-nucleoside phosphorylase [Oscillospiraceae bacterium]
MAELYPTPHIKATPAEFGQTVLMPGDPLRSKFIAETFLNNPVLINNVRGVQGYTGLYDGVRVSVMASGMGMPSMGIYSYELFNYFHVENILRIGSAGAIQESIGVRDIVVGMGACTDSNFAKQYRLPGTFSAIADYHMMHEAILQCEAAGATYHVGNLLSGDVFYNEDAKEVNPRWQKMGVMAIEMEAAALYMNAARAGKHALAICTVSDHILTGEKTDAEEREKSFTQMMEIALRTAVALEN